MGMRETVLKLFFPTQLLEKFQNIGVKSTVLWKSQWKKNAGNPQFLALYCEVMSPSSLGSREKDLDSESCLPCYSAGAQRWSFWQACLFSSHGPPLSLHCHFWWASLPWRTLDLEILHLQEWTKWACRREVTIYSKSELMSEEKGTFLGKVMIQQVST